MHPAKNQAAAFVARGEAAIHRWKQEGGGHEVDRILAELQQRLDRAKERRQALGAARHQREEDYRP